MRVLIVRLSTRQQLIMRKNIHKDDGRHHMVFVGSLSTRKQPQLVIEAVAKLNRLGHSLSLNVLGGGPLYQELVSLIADLSDDHIKLIGFCESPLSYVAEADILVLPSLSEGIPRAVMEALFIGIPCVVRNLQTNDNLVIEGVNGILFEKDHEIEGAILEAIELKRKVVDGRRLLGKSFSQKYCCERVLEEVRSLY